MRNSIPKYLPRKQLGQGMTEYIIIVALIALAAIASFSFFGQAIRGQSAQMANQVAGGSNDDGQRIAQEAADASAEDAELDVTLEDYNDRDRASN